MEIDLKFATEEIISTLNDFGIPFTVSGIESISDYCRVLLNGTSTVIVEDIESATQVLDSWIEAMQERKKFNK